MTNLVNSGASITLVNPATFLLKSNQEFNPHWTLHLTEYSSVSKMSYTPKVIPLDHPAIRVLDACDPGRGILISHLDKSSIKLKMYVSRIYIPKTKHASLLLITVHAA